MMAAAVITSNSSPPNAATSNGAASSLPDTSGNRRRACEYCGKVCSSSSALLYHTRLHTGERPYVCSVCSKGFIQKVHLQRHLENNHGQSLSSAGGGVSAGGSRAASQPPQPAQSRGGSVSGRTISGSGIGSTSPSAIAATTMLDLAAQLPTMVNANNVTPGNRLEALANQLKNKAEMVPCAHCAAKFPTQLAMLEHIFLAHSDIMQQTMQQWTGAMAAAAAAQQFALTNSAIPSALGTGLDFESILNAQAANLQMQFQANRQNADSANEEETGGDDLMLDELEDDELVMDESERGTVVESPEQRTKSATDKKPNGNASRAEPVTCPDCGEQHFGQIAFLEHVFEAHGRRVDDPQIANSADPKPPGNGNSSGDLLLPVTPSTVTPSQTPVNLCTTTNNNNNISNTNNSNSMKSSFSVTHHHKRNTWCPHCKKHLSSPTALVVHLRAHSGMKPFTCMLCQKSFMHQNSLKVHMLSHTGAKPHSCPVCGKSFTTTRTLKIHMMIHTGERPYGCKFCGRRFIQQIHLLRHIKSHIRRGTSKDIGQDSVSSFSSVVGGTGNSSGGGGGQRSTTTGNSNSGMFGDDEVFVDVPQPAHNLPQAPTAPFQPLTPIEHCDAQHSDSHSENDGGSSSAGGVAVGSGVAGIKMEHDGASANSSGADLVINLKTCGNGENTKLDESTGAKQPQSNTSSTTSSGCFDWSMISPNSDPNAPKSPMARPKSAEDPVKTEPIDLKPTARQRRRSTSSVLGLADLALHSHPSTFADERAPSVGCLNCQIMENELTLMKTEIVQLKQFLGNKLTLMERKVDTIKRCRQMNRT